MLGSIVRWDGLAVTLESLYIELDRSFFIFFPSIMNSLTQNGNATGFVLLPRLFLTTRHQQVWQNNPFVCNVSYKKHGNSSSTMCFPSSSSGSFKVEKVETDTRREAHQIFEYAGLIDLQPCKNGKMCLKFFKRRAPSRDKANKALANPSPLNGKSISRPFPILSHSLPRMDWMTTFQDQTEPSRLRANDDTIPTAYISNAMKRTDLLALQIRAPRSPRDNVQQTQWAARTESACAQCRDLGWCLGCRGRLRDWYRIEAMDEADGEFPRSGGRRLLELEQFAREMALPAPLGYDADRDEIDAPPLESSTLWFDPDTLARLEGHDGKGR